MDRNSAAYALWRSAAKPWAAFNINGLVAFRRPCFTAVAAIAASLSVIVALAQQQEGKSESAVVEASVAQFDGAIAPLLARLCRECHHGAEPNCGFSGDELPRDFNGAASRISWLKALERIQA